MHPDYLHEDLRSEVLLVLCEEEEWFIQELYYRGELKYWAARIMLNMVKSYNSAFYTTYRITNMPVPAWYDAAEEEDISDRLKREEVEDRALDAINNLHWYKRELLQMYLKLGSFRAVGKETGIPFQSVQRAFTNACRELKNKAYEKD